MARRACAWVFPSRRRCEAPARRESEFCRHHDGCNEAARWRFVTPPVRPENLDEFLGLPAERWQTLAGRARLAWYRDFLLGIAAHTTGGGIESLPWANEWEEPLLQVNGRGGLPMAALVVWRPTGPEVALGAGNLLAVARVTRSSVRLLPALDAATRWAEGQLLTLEDCLTAFDGGEIELCLRDGTTAPYLGCLYRFGQWFIAASPEVPWRESDVPGLQLPDLRLLDHPPERWHRLSRPAATNRSLTRVPGALSQQTSPEVRTAAQALADGPTGHWWQPVEGEAALRHVIPGQPLQTKLAAGLLLEWLELPTTSESLLRELAGLEFSAVLLFYVLVGLVLQSPEPVTVTPDELLQAIGCRPKGQAQRREQRRKLWRWLLLIDGITVHGQRLGKFRDAHTREVLDVKIHSALVRLAGHRGALQPALDASEPPATVTLAAGPWVERFRGNGRVLMRFGDVLRLARIPAGRPSGAWAQSIGLALQQRWRERAARAEVAHTGEENRLTPRFDPFTRRDLLGLFPCPPLVEELLTGPNPKRAETYWNEAIRRLKKAGVIGQYKMLRPFEKERQNWKNNWLDQPLDIRPKGEDAEDIAAIAKAAKARRRKPSSPGGG